MSCEVHNDVIFLSLVLLHVSYSQMSTVFSFTLILVTDFLGLSTMGKRFTE